MNVDDIAIELRALCIAKGWHRIDFVVVVDGRVYFEARDSRGFLAAAAEADLHAGGPLPAPSAALRALGVP